jgi:serine/threonine-protein kinase/endoribonuclease IRE1
LLAPLVRTHHVDQDPDLTDDLDACQETYIIEPQSGDIYVMATPSSPLRRFPYSVPELVDMSPFSFSAAADDHRVFVGRKATLEVVVQLETGEVRFGGADTNTCPWGPFPDLDERDEREPPPRRREVVLGRTGMYVPGDVSFRRLNRWTQTTTSRSTLGHPTNTV